jgi:IS30 family transposase
VPRQPGSRPRAAIPREPSPITTAAVRQGDLSHPARGEAIRTLRRPRDPPALKRKEGDLIVGAGRRSAIATVVERKTRHTILVPIRGNYSAQIVGDALTATYAQLPPALRRPLTWDQGNEMFHHERIEESTGVRIYFADPHSPWQRGSNENINGLLRQYFPKAPTSA